MSSSLTCVAWITVDDGPRTPASASSPIGVRPVSARHSSFSLICSEACTWSGAAFAVAQSRTAVIEAASTARTLWIAAATRVVREPSSAFDPVRPALRGRVAESPLGGGERPPADASPEVAGVDQRDPDPRVGRGTDQRLAHRVGVVVRHAAGGVVEVVELPDRGHPGERHLGVRRPREPVVAVRIQALDEPVHLLTPRPEVVRRRLRPPAQRAMQRVRVRIREPGEREAAQPDGVRRRVAVRDHRGDPVTATGDRHALRDPITAEPREVRVPGPLGLRLSGHRTASGSAR